MTETDSLTSIGKTFAGCVMEFSGSIMSDGKVSVTGVALWLTDDFTIGGASNLPPRIRISACNAVSLWRAYLLAGRPGSFGFSTRGEKVGEYVHLIG